MPLCWLGNVAGGSRFFRSHTNRGIHGNTSMYIAKTRLQVRAKDDTRQTCG